MRFNDSARRSIASVVIAICAVPLAACNVSSSEPEYGALSIEGFNYTPYNLTTFTVRDKYGNTASGGGEGNSPQLIAQS